MVWKSLPTSNPQHIGVFGTCGCLLTYIFSDPDHRTRCGQPSPYTGNRGTLRCSSHQGGFRMPFNLPEATQILQRTPAVLTEMVGAVPDGWIKATEGVGTWSCYDIVGHLIHGELTDWIPRARIILEHGETKAFEPFDRCAQFREDQTRPISALVDQFAFMRAENLAILQGLRLSNADLACKGT